ncbi:unnamed protein product [Knipowitschia caucasica]
MMDSEQTFLKDAIGEVLPDLPTASKDILEEHLQSIGVQCYDDFQFVEESDLLTALRPVQARKLLAAWKLKCQTPENSSQSSIAASPSPSPSPSHHCHCSLCHPEVPHLPLLAAQDLLHSGWTTLKFHGVNFRRNLCSASRGERDQALA